MIVVSRTFRVDAPAATVLRHLRDFGNTPGTTRRDSGPIVVGSAWHHETRVLGVRTYMLMDETPERLVFVGHNEASTATDVIAVAPGTDITFRLELEVHGVAKLAAPLLRADLERRSQETVARLRALLAPS